MVNLLLAAAGDLYHPPVPGINRLTLWKVIMIHTKHPPYLLANTAFKLIDEVHILGIGFILQVCPSLPVTQFNFDNLFVHSDKFEGEWICSTKKSMPVYDVC